MEQKGRICEISQCTGCFACMNVCPKDAISVKTDYMGKTIPKIDEEKCVDCGKCTQICPIEHKVELYPIQHCYAAKTKQCSDEKESASGGIAAGLYRYFLKNDGVVFGAGFDEHMTLRQMACETEEDMLKFRGSKYVQSEVGFTYRQVREALAKKRKVLYVSTPCQIAGLRAYLGREEDNLLLVDIICHGAPPMRYLKEYQKNVCGKSMADRASFRGKNDYQMCFYKNDNIIYKKSCYVDGYFSAFSDGIINRDNCYQCIYAQPNRVGDLTIGDFWGLNRKSLKTDMEGRISVVMINSKKGSKYFDKVKDGFSLEERDVMEGVLGNKQLQTPTSYSSGARKFRKIYPQKGFVRAVQATRTGKKAAFKGSIIGKTCVRLKTFIGK